MPVAQAAMKTNSKTLSIVLDEVVGRIRLILFLVFKFVLYFFKSKIKHLKITQACQKLILIAFCALYF